MSVRVRAGVRVGVRKNVHILSRVGLGVHLRADARNPDSADSMT